MTCCGCVDIWLVASASIFTFGLLRLRWYYGLLAVSAPIFGLLWTRWYLACCGCADNGSLWLCRYVSCGESISGLWCVDIRPVVVLILDRWLRRYLACGRLAPLVCGSILGLKRVLGFVLNVRGFWLGVVLVMDSSVCVCVDRFLDSIGGFTR